SIHPSRSVAEIWHIRVPGAVVVGRRQGGQDRKLLDHRFRGSNHTRQLRRACRTTIHLDAGYDVLLELVLWGQPDVAQDRAGEFGEEAFDEVCRQNGYIPLPWKPPCRSVAGR